MSVGGKENVSQEYTRKAVEFGLTSFFPFSAVSVSNRHFPGKVVRRFPKTTFQTPSLSHRTTPAIPTPPEEMEPATHVNDTKLGFDELSKNILPFQLTSATT